MAHWLIFTNGVSIPSLTAGTAGNPNQSATDPFTFGIGYGGSVPGVSCFVPGTIYQVAICQLYNGLWGGYVTNTFTTLPLPPTLQGLSVQMTNSASVVFQIPQALSTNYSIGGHYVAGGVTNTFAGTGPGPSVWEVGPLKAGTNYAFSFYAVDLTDGLTGPVATTNVTTLRVPTPLQGLSVWTVSPTNIVFRILPPLSTNYYVVAYYAGNGVTNIIGTGFGPPAMGIGPLQPGTAYAFTFYVGDAVNSLTGPGITTNITTLQVPGYGRISAQPLAGGTIRFSFIGNAGASYVMERTFQLVPPLWLPLVTNVADGNGLLVRTNAPIANTNIFWRFHLLP